MYKFLLHPNITTLYYHNFLLHPNITYNFPTSQIPTTNLEQQVPNTKLPKDIYIYIYIQVLYITKNIQEEFFYIQNSPQTATSSKQQHHVCVNKNIYTNVCVYNMLRMSSVSFASILNRNAFLSTSW